MPDFAIVITLLSTILAALLLPIGILVTRDNVKARRQGIIKDLEIFFRSNSGGKSSIIPSFEFVKTKYYVDPNVGYAEPGIKWYSIPIVVFIGICCICFFISFGLITGQSTTNFHFRTFIQTSVFFGGGEPPDIDLLKYVERATTVAMFAFLGAYIYAIKNLVRSVANFDLSPLTFFRCSYGIIAAVVIAVTLWRAVPAISLPDWPTSAAQSSGADPAFREAPAQPSPGSAPPSSVAAPSPPPGNYSDAWLFIAFVIGFVPGQAERLLVSSWRRGGIKRLDERATDQSKTVPLDLIDGIDADVRARLEDFNLFDVQNLATANPIMLFVETPFGIYQSIDWVAQAQLATAVGVGRFIMLRELAIRNIFSLERLFSSAAPAEAILLQQKVADVLVGADNPQEPSAQRITYARMLTDLYIDELAVMRLRQIWMTIERNFAETRRLEPYQQKDIRSFDPRI